MADTSSAGDAASPSTATDQVVESPSAMRLSNSFP